jgi:MFS family permease
MDIYFGGIITILFPMVSWISIVGIAVVMVIFIDAVMTFFGSTANDAAFNAWTTDISHSSNRNRIQTLTSLSLFLAIAITYGVAGMIIDNFGYFIFFYIFGGLITFVGLLSGVLIKSNPSTNELDSYSSENQKIKKSSVWQEFKSLINPKILRDNKILFLLFINMAITGISSQIYLPYIFQFLEYYIGFSKTQYSTYIIIFMPILIVCIIFLGWISHKFNRKSIIILGTITGAILSVILGLISPYLKENVDKVGVFAVLLYVIGQIPTMASGIAHGGWVLDSYPEGNVGKFQGIRMIFMVAIPMLIGPPIGSFIIHSYGIPIDDGFIPTPEIFILGGILSLLAIIPILFIKKEAGKVKLLS